MTISLKITAFIYVGSAITSSSIKTRSELVQSTEMFHIYWNNISIASTNVWLPSNPTLHQVTKLSMKFFLARSS